MHRIYNDLYTFPRRAYNARNMQRNSEKIKRKEIKLVDKGINALKLSTLSAQVKYILVLIVNVEK